MKLFDGGMGTMLQRHGLSVGHCPDYYNISHPDIVQSIHKAYKDAGSEWITTNTFGTSHIKLSDYDLSDKVEAIAEAAVQNIRIACGNKVHIAGDIGPSGKFIHPIGELSFDEACENFYRSAKALSHAGADYLIIETMIDIQEMKAAVIAAKAACSLPIITQMSYLEDGRTITGTDPKSATILLDALGADIIGANCSLGPEQLLSVASDILSVTNKPVIIQPNAGLPIFEHGETIFPLQPEDFASSVSRFAELGVSYFGGCCGTTPEHIKAIKEILPSLPASARAEISPFTALTSRTNSVFIGDAYAPVKIGERINPTGRKKLREDIQAGSFVSVKKEALEQIHAGTHVLDVNMGVPGINQIDAMKNAILQLSVLCPTPLSIDSTDPKVIEAALKIYPGRPLINSVNAENKDTMRQVLQLAKTYGAAVLCLPLSKGELPETAEKRVSIIHQIIKEAKEIGLRKEDLLLDPLVLTVGAGKDGAKETLRTIALYKKEFGFPCVMGTSNISFGLPARPQINASFLTMAFAIGINAPIINPLDKEIQKAFINANLLLGFDPGANHFIQSVTTESAAQKEPPKTDTNQSPLEALKDAIKNGEKEIAVECIKKCIQEHISSESLIQDALTPAMTEIGDGYGAGKVYLPQVMMAAEAMQSAFSTLKELFPHIKKYSKGTFIIGTVQGDIHDLGKNIVAALMENSGYKVIDLGKDVSIDTFIESSKKYNADITGLCSLMTTTLPELEATVKVFKEKMPGTSIMVGGAVVTPEYAETIGADSYSKDGIDAIHKADEIMKNRS